jgi:mitogen-activated protein kinase 1/3
MSSSSTNRTSPPSPPSIPPQKFILPCGYTGIRIIGSGAYGVVVSAKDLKGQSVAVKRIPNWTSDVIDGKRILREVKLLRFLRGRDNILKLLAIDADEACNDVYIITELMDSDLHKILYSKQQVLTTPHIQWFVCQALRSLQYLHSAGIIHRDLKPSNLLVNADCSLVLADFGLARGVSLDDGQTSFKTPPGGEAIAISKADDLNLTEYVVTRWYRASELMLGRTLYTSAVDVFSLGCILAELYRRKPLAAGTDFQHQLRLLTTILGSPTEEELKSFVTSQSALSYMQKLPFQPKGNWTTILKTSAPDEAIDLLNKMLTWSPVSRITVEQALQHPFVRTFSSGRDNLASVKTAQFDYSFERLLKGKGTDDVATLKRLMKEEIESFKKEIKSK